MSKVHELYASGGQEESELHQTNKSLPPYSLLMSVYDMELPENLNESLESMLMQTYPPSEVVLVFDGRLTCELTIIAKSFESEFRSMFKIVRIDEHVGAAAALNEGIKACTCPYIVRMDSDDIAYPDRCEKQMTLFRDLPKLDMIGTFAEVYDFEANESVGVKAVPTSHRKLVKYAKRKNPFCRQTLAFKRSKAIEAGGYSDLDECEDYEFAARMLAIGARGKNIPEPLVRYRISDRDYKKLSSKKHTKSFIKAHKMLRHSGFCSLFDMVLPCAFQMMLCILPWKVTKRYYTKRYKKGIKLAKTLPDSNVLKK